MELKRLFNETYANLIGISLNCRGNITHKRMIKIAMWLIAWVEKKYVKD